MANSVDLQLVIGVVGATGRGPTSLAAFDDCLRSTGTGNFNLIRLSSVIPPGTTVVGAADHVADDVIDLSERPEPRLTGTWGDRLYAVWAFQSAQLLGEEAWAGVAWVQHPDDGRGLFVEHEGGSELQVRRELEATLSFMCEARGLGDLEHHSVVAGCRCEGSPVGALVIAPYSIAPWSGDD